MMDPSAHRTANGAQSTRPNPNQDDETVATPPRGERTKPKDRQSVEITIKFRFVPTSNNDNIHPAILHAHWMHEVTKAFGGDVVQFFDNRNRQVSKFEPLRIDPNEHIQQFQLHIERHTHQSKNKTTTTTDFQVATSYIVHRIRSFVPLSELKTTATVFKLMQDHNFYVNEHRWSETDWETTQLGFLYGLDPQFYDIDQATTKFTNTIRQALPRTKIPKFRLVYCSPKIKTAKGRIVRTKAYAVETMRADRDELNKHLKEVYKESGTFVPFQMRNRHPDAFERFVKAQTRMLSSNYVIVLNHIGPDAMHYMSDRITAVPGVLSLLPCLSVNEDGKYKILVHQKNYHQVRNHLKEVIPKWYHDHVEPDAKAHEGRYPGPPEVSAIESDGISQSDHTYLTISINTAMSISSNISNDSPPTFIYRNDHQSTNDESTLGGTSQTNSSNLDKASWAEKVRGSRTYSSSEPTSTAESERHKVLQKELEISRQEVTTLKERLAKVEGAQVQDQADIEAKVQLQVSQIMQEQFRIFTKEMMMMFSQMMMTHQTSNMTKRSAAQIDDEPEEADSQTIAHYATDGAKRWDNKPSPWKMSASKTEDEDQNMWMKPKKLIDQMENQTPISEKGKSSPTQNDMTRDRSVNKGKNNLDTKKPDSEEADFIERGSGTESTNKTSTWENMDLEASETNNE